MTKDGKHCCKRRNYSFLAISSFVTVFKKPSAAEASESVYMRERVKDQNGISSFQFSNSPGPDKPAARGQILQPGLHHYLLYSARSDREGSHLDKNMFK